MKLVYLIFLNLHSLFCKCTMLNTSLGLSLSTEIINTLTRDSLWLDLLEELSSGNLQSNDNEKFKFLVTKLLDSHEPMKERRVSCNQSPFMDKGIRKAIMTRTCLPGLTKIVKLTKNRKKMDQVYSNTRVSTQVKMSQHDPAQVRHKSTRINPKWTRTNTSLKQV